MPGAMGDVVQWGTNRWCWETMTSRGVWQVIRGSGHLTRLDKKDNAFACLLV